MKPYFFYILFGTAAMMVTLLKGYQNEEKNNLITAIKYETDTTIYKPNTTAGWDSYKSYANQSGDSVVLELILYRNNADSLDWNQEFTVGRITEKYFPQHDQVIKFNTARINWQLTILTSGWCQLRMISREISQQRRIVLPVQIKYKKS